MANLKAKIRGNPQKIIAQTLKIGNVALADLTDVDSSGQTDGAVIQYNGSTNKFVMKTNLDGANLTITGGTY
tara:strand:+ start:65 stop:280 length:216 start_codon:yes stop_codon:yes gene_type:complete